MRPNERVDDLLNAVRSALDGFQPNLWTALPGVVDSVDLEKGTCSVQPAIKSQVTSKDGSRSWVELPLLVDVPIQFMGGGGFVMTFPFAAGDEGLVVFACRCIDSWWQSGGVQTQAELRMHDLSDGFFVPGFRSQPKKITNINPDYPEWRNADRSIRMEQTAVGYKVTGVFEVNGVIIGQQGMQLNGNIRNVSGTGVYTGDFTTAGDIIAGSGTGDQVTLRTHRHPANNIPPTPGT